MRQTNIIKIKSKIFRNFVLNYTHFLSTEYKDSITYNFNRQCMSERNPFCSYDTLEKYIKDNIQSGEVLVIMGAGNIYKLVDKF